MRFNPLSGSERGVMSPIEQIAYLRYENEGKTRNRRIAPELEQMLKDMADRQYGEQSTVVVRSGGQTPNRNPFLKNRPGGWTGSTRHDDHGEGGMAADVGILAEDGSPVRGPALAKAGADWLSNKYGGVGALMGRDGSTIHLDMHKDRAPLWNYANKGGMYTPQIDQILKSAMKGGQAVGGAVAGAARPIVSAMQQIAQPEPQRQQGMPPAPGLMVKPEAQMASAPSQSMLSMAAARAADRQSVPDYAADSPQSPSFDPSDMLALMQMFGGNQQEPVANLPPRQVQPFDLAAFEALLERGNG